MDIIFRFERKVAGSTPAGCTSFMTYERFKQLWDEILGDRVTEFNASDETMKALIEYGQGNKTKIESVRKFLTKAC